MRNAEIKNQGPAASSQQPGTRDQLPVTSSQEPETRDQQSATSNQGPATSNQGAATSDQEPATRNQQPEASDRFINFLIEIRAKSGYKPDNPLLQHSITPLHGDGNTCCLIVALEVSTHLI